MAATFPLRRFAGVTVVGNHKYSSAICVSNRRPGRCYRETRLKAFLHPGRARPFVLVTSALLGVAGWAFLALATYWPGFAPVTPPQPDVLAFAMFLFVIVAAR